MKIQWINHSCLQFHLAGKVIYTDPYQIPKDNSYEKADIIIVSHSHGDHYDANSINNVKKDETRVICPATCEDIIKKENGTGLKLYEMVEISGLKIQGVPSYNPNKRFHPKENFQIDRRCPYAFQTGNLYPAQRKNSQPTIDSKGDWIEFFHQYLS